MALQAGYSYVVTMDLRNHSSVTILKPQIRLLELLAKLSDYVDKTICELNTCTPTKLRDATYIQLFLGRTIGLAGVPSDVTCVPSGLCYG